MRYSIEPTERRHVKGYGFLSFPRNLNNKYGQKLVDSAKKSATDSFKDASKRAIQKTAEATGDLIGNKTADKITRLLKKTGKWNTSCKSNINNVEIDSCHDIDIVMPMFNLIEYSDNYAKTSGSLWQYYRDEPNDNLANSKSFKYKIKITGKTPDNSNEKDVEIMVPLKYLSNFWRTLEIPLINCEVSLNLTWSPNCVITNSTGEGKFKITDTNLYVPVVTLSTKDNEKLLQQLGSGFKRVINRNKYLSKPGFLAQNPNLNYLIEPSFQGVNRLFVLAFEDDAQRKVHSGYYLPNVVIKNYNVMIN